MYLCRHVVIRENTTLHGVHVPPHAGMEAQQIIIVPPMNTTVTLGGTATFSCSASDVVNVTFVVAGIDPSMWASRGISQTTSISGGYTTANLTVLGNITNNGIQVTCRVGSTDILPPVQLTIKGLLMNELCSMRVIVVISMVCMYPHESACLHNTFNVGIIG